MNKLERRIFLLDAKIAGLNTEIVVLRTSNDDKVMKRRQQLRKEVGRLTKQRKEAKEALA